MNEKKEGQLSHAAVCFDSFEINGDNESGQNSKPLTEVKNNQSNNSETLSNAGHLNSSLNGSNSSCLEPSGSGSTERHSNEELKIKTVLSRP